MLDRENLF
jgi:CRP-like cAMP-binding protein